MSILKFTDGVKINASGEYRQLRLRDGYYVIGHDKIIPVNSADEAKGLIRELNKKRESK